MSGTESQWLISETCYQISFRVRLFYDKNSQGYSASYPFHLARLNPAIMSTPQQLITLSIFLSTPRLNDKLRILTFFHVLISFNSKKTKSYWKIHGYITKSEIHYLWEAIHIIRIPTTLLHIPQTFWHTFHIQKRTKSPIQKLTKIETEIR